MRNHRNGGVAHRRRLARLLFTGVSMGVALPVSAQFKVSDSFQGNTQAGWTIAGTNNAGSNDSGILTAGYGAIPNNVNDPAGNGWLRLTTNLGNQDGGALYTSNSFSPANGVVVEFEYVAWGGTGADGISFFLYDAGTNMAGALSGASLRYCWGAGGYLGVGLDAFGNFSSNGATGRCPNNDGPGNRPDSVVVRGPRSANNPYVGGATVAGGIDVPSVTARPTPNRVRYALVPNGSGGYRVTVAHGVNGATPTTVLNNLNFPYTAPALLRFGIAATTGGSNNIHEIRNVVGASPADIGVSKTVSATSVYPGQSVGYTVVITNKDINPVDAGNQAPPITAANAPDIADILSAQLTGASWTCTASAGSTCPAASGTGNLAYAGGYTLAPGGTLTFAITATLATTATCAATITNTASAVFSGSDNYADTTPSDNSASASFTVNCDDLAISKSNGQSEYRQNQTFAYTMVVSNPGANAVGNAVFTDPAVANFNVASVTCGSATGGATCPTPANTTVALMQGSGIVIPSLPASGSVTFTVTGTTAANAAGSLTNVASIAVPANRTEATPANNTATDTDTLATANVAVTKTRSGSGAVLPGSVVNFTLQVVNTGPSVADGTTVSDPVAAGLNCTAITTCTATGGAVCPATGAAQLAALKTVAGLAIPGLPSGGTVTLGLACTVTATGFPP